MYVYENLNPQGKNVGDCAIRAVAKATGQTWIQAYMALYVHGLQLADLANSDAVWTSYLRNKGFTRGVIPDTCPDCYTVADFAEDHPVGTFVLGTGSHAVAVIDGTIYDAWDSSNAVPIFFMQKGR
jgi:hypothetical protein